MRSLIVAVSILSVALAGGTPAAAQTVQTGVQYGEADGVPLTMDVYLPPEGQGNGIGVVVIHGGRWMTGDPTETPAELIAAQGFAAFAVRYRLAPEHPYPAAIEDLQTAVRYIREHAGELGIDPDKIWAIGGSAGGHLAALLGTIGEGPTTEGARIAAVASWSGPMDLELLAASSRGLEQAATQFVGCTGLRDPSCLDALREASPVSHLDPSDPPMFIANGTEEPIPFEQAVIGARAAEAASVDAIIWTVEGTLHGFSYVREVLPPTEAFVLNEIEGQDNPLDPPSTPQISVRTPTPRITHTPTDRTPEAASRSRDGGALPLVIAIMALVGAAVIGMVFLVRGSRARW